MKNKLIAFTLMLLFSIPALAAEPLILAEMAMSENWQYLSDSSDVSVVWYSDTSALLAVNPKGLDLLSDSGLSIEQLDEWANTRDYYIISSRTGLLPEAWTGLQLKSDHFLCHFPRGTILPGNKELGYQRIHLSNRPISSLAPRVYEGYASKDYNPFIQSVADQVQSSYLESLLTTMVGFVTRYSYTDGCIQSVNWAESEFQSWGYTTEQFPHTSGMAPNVIAWKYGSETPDNIWVIGGHLDSISNNNPSNFAPGADDNGTGSALTMCCANLVQDLNFADTIVFALWTGEEQGLYGSDAWAEWASGQSLNILGYYNFDMIGWVEPSPEDLDVLVNSASQSFGQDFVDIADMYTNMLHDLQVENVTASDHYSFWQEGYTAFCAIEDYWPTYPYYHTDNDTVDKVDFPFFSEVTKAMVANICTAAQLTETIATGQEYAACDTNLDLMVIDFDATSSITVNVASDTEPVPESITLTETSDHLFEGTVQLADSAPIPGNGLISVVHGDTVTVTYSGVSGTGSTSIDCVAPAVSAITLDSISSETATISFETNEIATGSILYGVSSPDTTATGSSAETSHTIAINALDDCTTYVYSIEVTDEAGNTTTDDNGGQYYTFTTLERLSMLTENMDTDPQWTYSGQWAWGQPTGQGGNYGDPDPTQGYTGNNVVGYNLNGDYSNSMTNTEYVTTQTIDCSDAQGLVLTFYAWLGVEQDQYDHANIEISNNNGTSWTSVWENSSTLNGGSWEFWEFDITDYAAGYPQVKVRWGIGPTDSGWAYCGWNIDDLEIFSERDCVVAPTPTPEECLNHGDVNASGDITAGDAQIAFQIALGSISPTPEQECFADCNGNGEVTAGDAQTIFMAALGSQNCVDPL